VRESDLRKKKKEREKRGTKRDLAEWVRGYTRERERVGWDGF
jgi:hypothetical protein